MRFACEYCGQSLIRIGQKIRANITDFNITKGKIYKIKGIGECANCIYIVNDLGQIEEYSVDYFSAIKR